MQLLTGQPGAEEHRPPGGPAGRARPAPTLRRRLVGFALAAALPLLLLAGGAVWQQHRAERARAEEGLVARAYAMALLLDREFAAAGSTAQALAGSPALARGDLATFWAEMRASAAASGARAINLVGADGAFRLSTAWLPGQRLGTKSSGPAEEALATGRPVIGDLYVSATTAGWAVAVAVPLALPDGTRNVLGLVLPRERLLATLTDQRLPAGAIASVLDRRERVVARTVRDQQAVATRPPPQVLAGMAAQAGIIKGYRGLEGERVVAAYATAPQSGFRVKVTMPEAAYDAALRQALFPTLLVGGGLLCAALGFGTLFAGRLAESLRRVGDPGHPLAGGTAVREFDELGDLLARRTAVREQAAAELRSLFDHSPVGVVRCDAGGRVTDGNDAFLRIVGMARADLVAGRVRWDDLTPPEWIGRDEAAIAEAVQTGACAPYQKEYVRPDGTRVPVLIFFAFHDVAHGVASAFVVDLSGWQATEAALAHAHEQMRLAMQAARIYSWDWNVLSGAVQWSTGLAAAMGMVEGSFGGTVDAFRALVHPADLPRVEEALGAALDGTRPYDIEFRMLRPDGGNRWVVTRGTVLRDGTGRPVRMIGIDFDITDRKHTEIALAESKAALGRITEAARVATFELDEPAAGRPATVSQGFRALHGLPPEAACDYAGMFAQVHPEDRPALLAGHRRLAAEGGRYEAEFRVIPPDGGTRWILAMGEGEPGPGELPRRLRGVALDISARKAVEADLALAEARQADLLETLDLGAFMARDLDGTIRFWSRGCERLYGWTREDAVGRVSHQLLQTAFPVPLAEIETALEREGEWTGDLRHRTRLGEERVMAAHKALRRGPGGSMVVMEALVDVTAQRRAEEALAASETRLRLATAGTGIGTWELDLVTGWGQWSEEAAALLGTGVLEVTAERWAQALHPEDRAAAAEAWQRAVAEGTPYEATFRPAAGGGDRWLVSRGLVERDAAGRPLRGLGVLIDVTGRRRMEAALAEREAQLKLFIDRAPVAIAMFDAGMRYLAVSRRFLADRGLPLELPEAAGTAGLLGRSHYEVFPDLAQHWRDVHRRVLAGETLAGEQDAFRHPDGSLDWIRWEMGPWRRPDGGIGGALLFSEVITARVRAEQALLQSELRLRLATEAADIGVWEWDIATGAVTWDVAMARICGHPQPQGPGGERLFSAHVQPADQPALDAAVARALDPGGDGQFRAEFRFRRGDGRWRVLVGLGRVLHRSDGQPHAMVGVTLDITEAKEAEAALARANAELEARVSERTAALIEAAEELRAEMRRREETQAALVQAQKLEALGQLTGSVAHDFNNVLAAVMGSLRLIAKRARDNHQILTLAESGERAAERAATLIRQLMAFARREELQPVVVVPAEVLAGAGHMLRRAVGSGVTLSVARGAQAWPVLTDPHRLEVALLNLAMNARDAMAGVGTLAITLRDAPPGEAPGRPAGLAAERDFVVIALRDSGPGMPPEVLARAAEPFFTTKPRGHGTGLGLAMVHEFAAQSGGALRLLSPPGEGLTAEIWLPRARPDAGVPRLAEAAAEPDPALHGGATILVVDDDEQVRLVMATQLRDLGYEVVEADGVDAAMARARDTAQLHLAITDVTMPGGRGPDLALRLRAARPGLPILFASGYGDPGVLASEVVIAKPYTPVELAYRVLVALGRLPTTVHERMLMRLSRPELRALYTAWRALREAAGGDRLPTPAALALAGQPGADHAYLVVAEGEAAGAPQLRFRQVGSTLARRLGRSPEGELAGGALEEDEVFGGIGDAYHRCVRLGVPCHDYARFGFGDHGEPLYFERLLLPLAEDGGSRPTHLAGMAFFSDPA